MLVIELWCSVKLLHLPDSCHRKNPKYQLEKSYPKKSLPTSTGQYSFIKASFISLLHLRADFVEYLFLFCLLRYWLFFPFIWDKIHWDWVYAVTCVFLGEPFTYEDMTQMCAAFSTGDFSAPSIGVGFFDDGARNFFVKARPSALGLKFIFGAIKRRAATSANICAFIPKRVELSCKRRFRAFMDNDTFFFRSQLSILWSILRQKYHNYKMCRL